MSIFILHVFPGYSVYLSKTTVQEGTKAIFVFLFIAVVFLFTNKYIRETKRKKILMMHFNNFFLGLCIYLMFFENGTMGHRLSLYGTIYSLLILPEIVYVLKNPKERMIIKGIFYLFCILFFFFTVSVGSEMYIPYKFYWQ